MNEQIVQDPLSRYPKQAMAFEISEDGRVTLIRPKILGARWAWLLRLLRKPNYRVKLDEMGGFVWNRCDGSHSVRDLVAEIRQAFPDKSEHTEERILGFLQHLLRGRFVTLD